jgi:hypothetical protein
LINQNHQKQSEIVAFGVATGLLKKKSGYGLGFGKVEETIIKPLLVKK